MKTDVRSLVLAALFLALAVALPMAFHAVPNAGGVFLPMHLPVLLCGLLLGAPLGFACGLLAPLMSCLITGMPPMAILPAMTCELAVYGLVAGLLPRLIARRAPSLPSLARLYIALVAAMLAGRLAAGAVNALFFQAGRYSLQAWLAASFVRALPGIAAQLAVLPALALVLARFAQKTPPKA